MQRRHTKEEYVAKARSVHGDKYDYSLVSYEGSRNKIKIVCPLHGEFLQFPAQHLQGRGCKACGYSKASKSARNRCASTFVERATAAHNSKYTYEHAIYVHSEEKLQVTCPTHGVFEVAPTHHVNDLNGCPACDRENRKHTLQSFVEKAKLAHGDLYNYSLVNYIANDVKVKIICEKHGIFNQSPAHHWKGASCPICVGISGYTDTIPGKVYVLRGNNSSKLGITNKLAEHRAAQISSSAGEEFSVVKVFNFECGKDARLIEASLLKKLRAVYKNPDMKFDGYSECFVNLDADELCELVEAEIAA